MSIKPQIENSDRGLTINKSLAWSVCTALVLAGGYVGRNLATLNGATATLSEKVNVENQGRGLLETRVRALENFRASTSAQIDGLGQSLDEVKLQQRENNSILRDILSRLTRPN
jgi:hypothetical protein